MPSYFAKHLLYWHKDTPRELPWSSGPRDPYHIWISEIIMQQTRIEQGAAYYHRFINRFPDIYALARAKEDEVLRYWQGLGYYTRARNLHATAKQVVNVYHGSFPPAYEELLKLPGIGPYSAAAIASFAFGLSYPVVDGNVKRVISRFAGIHAPVDLPATHDEIRSLASTYMSGVAAADFNQAIMNFGALVCKPKNPLCAGCSFSKKCYAFTHQLVDKLPVKTKKKPTELRHFHFIVLQYRNNILLERRNGKDIWKGLFAPPLIETASTRIPAIKINAWIEQAIGHTRYEMIRSSDPEKQLLSHQTLIGRFHYYRLLKAPARKNPLWTWASQKQWQQLGKPRMVAEMPAQ